MVLEPCLELALPVKHPGKRRSQQETAGTFGSRALKPWGVGIACPALGGQHCPGSCAQDRADLGDVSPRPRGQQMGVASIAKQVFLDSD